MRTSPASFFVAAALAALPVTHLSAGTTAPVLRCQMEDGSTLYTNKACSSFGAKPRPLSADVLERIARQQRYEARLAAQAAYADLPVDATDSAQANVLPAQVPARRPVSDGCATTPRQLALDLQASVAMGDVNRVAESFDWAGMRHQQAHRILSQLQQLTGEGTVVAEADYFGDAGYGEDASGDTGGLMQVAFDGDGWHRLADFDVRKDRSCYFLRYA